MGVIFIVTLFRTATNTTWTRQFEGNVCDAGPRRGPAAAMTLLFVRK